MFKQVWVNLSVQRYVEVSLGLSECANSMLKRAWVYPSVQRYVKAGLGLFECAMLC